MQVIRPKRSSWMLLVLATSFLWVLGFVSVLDDFTDIYGYTLIFFSLLVVLYNYTEEIVIDHNRFIKRRYWFDQINEQLSDILLKEGRVGIPSFLNGYVILRKDKKQIGHIISGNYAEADIKYLISAINTKQLR